MNEFHHAVCALCAKADIPQIEAAIRLLDPLVRRRLEELSQDLFDEIVQRLETLSGRAWNENGRSRDEVLDALLAALLLRVERSYGSFLDSELRQHVEDSVDAIFGFAMADLGFELPAAQAALLRQTAVDQLNTMLGDTVNLRQTELGNLLRRELVSPVEALASGDAFRVELAKILAPAAAAALAVDAWAYLWTNIAGVEAAQAAGIRAFEVVAVGGRIGDGRTTRFCRWAHGRLIPLSRIREQIAALTNGSLRGDSAALRASWPFLDAETARNGNELQFELFFRRAGLAPYHYRCRSRALPVRIER